MILATMLFTSLKGNYMKITILSAFLATTAASTSFAQDAIVSVDATAVKVESSDVIYSVDVGADIQLYVTDTVTALVSAELTIADVADDASDVELTHWAVGAEAYGVTVTAGEQSNLFTESLMTELGGYSLATVQGAEYSLIVRNNTLSGFVGYDSVTEDWTNIQVAGTFDLATNWVAGAVMDYQNVGDTWAIGADVSGSIGNVTTDAVVTYTDVDQALGYEVAVGYRVGAFGLTGFAGGSNNTDAVDYVGAGAITNIEFVNIWAETAYNLDSEDTAFATGVSFTF
jgi:hypothetical protein